MPNKKFKKTNKTTTEEPGSARSKSCVDITEASELKDKDGCKGRFVSAWSSLALWDYWDWWIIQTCYSRLHYFLYLSYKNKQTKPLVLIVCFLCHLTYIISNKYSLHVQFGQRNNYIFHKLLTFTECNVSTNKLTLEIKNKDDKKWSTEFFYKHYEISFGQSVPKVMR